MKPNVYRRLLRPGRSFLWLFAYLVYPITFVARAHQSGALAFQWWCFTFPLSLGVMLAVVLREPMHRPFAVVLPGAGRRFFRSHITIVGCAALLFAAFAHWADRTLPVISVAGIVAASLTLALPAEPGGRWAGSRVLFWSAVAAGLAAVVFAGDVKIFAVTHPWVVGTGGVVLTVLSYVLTFSPDRRRMRASNPYTSYLTAMFSPEFTRQVASEALARQKSSRASA